MDSDPSNASHPGLLDEWASLYEQARSALNTPSGNVTLPALSVMRLITELRHFRPVCEVDWDSDGEDEGWPIACNWSTNVALIGSLKGGQNLYAIVSDSGRHDGGSDA